MAGRRIDPSRYTDPGLLSRIMDHTQLVWRLLTDSRVPTALKVLIPALVVLYTVSPIDAIPDFLLGLGQLDDIGLILAGLALFVKLAPRHIVDEHRAAMSGQSTPVAETASPADDWWRSPSTDGGPSRQPIDVDYTMDGRKTG